MSRTRVALVGFGAAGRQHAQALAGASSGVLHGVLEHNRELETPGQARRYGSWAEVLADPDVDLVALCTPAHGRAELAEEALKAGKGVLLETPAAVSTDELDRLVELAEVTGRPAAVMLPHRFALPEEVLGWTWQPSATAVLEVSRFRPAAALLRGARQDPAEPLGGVLAQVGVHYLDLACQLLGEPVEVASAGLREIAPGIETRVVGSVRFASGATLSFGMTVEAVTSAERLSVMDGEQRLVVEDGRIAMDRSSALGDRPALPALDLRRALYADVTRALASGGQPRRCGLAGARAVTWITETVWRTGRDRS